MTWGPCTQKWRSNDDRTSFFRVFWPTHIVFQRNVMGFCCLRSGSLVSVAASCQASPHDDNANIWVHIFLLSHPYLRFWLTHILPIWKRCPGGSTEDPLHRCLISLLLLSPGVRLNRKKPAFCVSAYLGPVGKIQRSIRLFVSQKMRMQEALRCGAGVPMELLNSSRF